jgi:hypothetical protein
MGTGMQLWFTYCNSLVIDNSILWPTHKAAVVFTMHTCHPLYSHAVLPSSMPQDRLHILHSLLHLPSLKTVGLDVGGPAAAAPFHARGCAVEDYAWPVAKRFYV